MINLGLLLVSLSPVARDHWGIFELIIKESGDKGRDGKGRKSPSLFLSFPTLAARALRSFPSSLSRVLGCSPIPTQPWDWACGEGSASGSNIFLGFDVQLPLERPPRLTSFIPIIVYLIRVWLYSAVIDHVIYTIIIIISVGVTIVTQSVVISIVLQNKIT